MKKILFLSLILSLLTGCSNNAIETNSISQTTNKIADINDTNDEYTIYEVDACDLSGDRKPNAKVDVGFGDREYWAYTNEYGQLVRVVAKEITLQDEENEPVTDKGRYCKDEAKVPGTERKEYDSGHLVFDAGGGSSNAYNIVPQNSTLNRHGSQQYMERNIRESLKAGGTCTDFEAVITYPNTDTQIPSYFKYTYTLNGNVIVDEFPNVDPDSVPVKEEKHITVPDFSDVDTFIINTNSKKIHKADCESVEKMSNKNKEGYFGNINDLIDEGYEPCKICISN